MPHLHHFEQIVCNQTQTDAIRSDVKAAFDTVNQYWFIHNLQNYFICGILLEWIV